MDDRASSRAGDAARGVPDAVRLRLTLAYDGTGFSGWARQPGRRTVQHEVESALATVMRLPAIALTVAGRTDAGVHARGQVAHCVIPTSVPRAGLARRLNGVLERDVRVLSVAVAPPGFDARFSARSRCYAYRVTDAAFGAEPLRRHDTLAWPRPLSLPALADASTALLGEHDFAAFCRRREGATTIRTLLRLEWRRDGDSPGAGQPSDGVLTATVEADAFCHSMVRALVGAMLAVGEGRRPTSWPAQVLAGGVRSPEVTVAPAHGLTLLEVRYPPDDELAVRAELTRARRLPTLPLPSGV